MNKIETELLHKYLHHLTYSVKSQEDFDLAMSNYERIVAVISARLNIEFQLCDLNKLNS